MTFTRQSGSEIGSRIPALYPTGVLKATDKPKNAMTNQPVLLEGTGPGQQLNLRHPGQYEDAETGLRDNINRMLSANTGRYTQYDPIGQAGGPNGYLYADANPLSITDPLGLMGQGSGASSLTVKAGVSLLLLGAYVLCALWIWKKQSASV